MAVLDAGSEGGSGHEAHELAWNYDGALCALCELALLFTFLVAIAIAIYF